MTDLCNPRRSAARLTACAAAFSLFGMTCGCNPTIRTTVENGIISTTQSLLTATVQALIQLNNESQ